MSFGACLLRDRVHCRAFHFNFGARVEFQTSHAGNNSSGEVDYHELCDEETYAVGECICSDATLDYVTRRVDLGRVGSAYTAVGVGGPGKATFGMRSPPP